MITWPTMKLRLYKPIRAMQEYVPGCLSPVYGEPVLQQWWANDKAIDSGEWRDVPIEREG